ncbi:MAG: acyl carrier protein [Deltaproteobacteria bacterium]|jgi:acyl carrier protein|nr:acyl carrier protein [Deltaproteobacteria bacterium]
MSALRLAPPADPTDLASVEAWILELARRELRLDRPIAPDADLSGALDSLQRLALVVAIEDHLQLSFEPEDDEQANTLRDVVQIVARRLAERRGGQG